MSRSNNKELYNLLGVSPTASSDEIRSAYKKAALKEHPDKGGNEETFKKIAQAYQILSDDEKRRHYDMTGVVNTNDRPPPGSMPMPHPFNFDIPFDLGKIFGGFRGAPGPRQKGDKAPPRIQRVPISLSQFYHGHSFEVKINRMKFCEPCRGSSYKSRRTCDHCGGSGSVAQIIQMGPMSIKNISPCGPCSGEGNIGADKCEVCEGQGKQPEEKTLKVDVKPGVAAGTTIVFESMCSDSNEYARAGDVHIILDEAPDEDWKRVGADLRTTVTLTLAESLIGCRLKFNEHPSKDPVICEVGAGVTNGDELRFVGQGMPGGHLIVTVQVRPRQDEREKLQREGRAYLASLFGIQLDSVVDI
jgi:DnaJ-class molecular chaperone